VLSFSSSTACLSLGQFVRRQEVTAMLGGVAVASQKLKKLGYVEGETLRLECRFAEGHDDALVQCPANVS
jgi:hypothetical protein